MQEDLPKHCQTKEQADATKGKKQNKQKNHLEKMTDIPNAWMEKLGSEISQE